MIWAFDEDVESTVTQNLLATAEVVREPVGAGPGYWCGAPGACYAADERAWYLTYRIRRPRGVEPDRGGEARIAYSTDLRNWRDLWTVNKSQFQTASMERAALKRGPDGRWRYFASFVDPADGRWCVSVLKSAEIQALDASTAVPVFTAGPLGLEGVKDPWIMEWDGVFHMILSVALPTRSTTSSSHSTLDIFNTGQCLSATGMALSRDLDKWEWQGVIFSPVNSGWDGYCRRINSIIPTRGGFLAFYDGSSGHHENYEEKTGLAISKDLRSWRSLTPSCPLFTSPHASGSLRYLDAVMTGETPCLFYELARPEGSHDLRLTQTKLESLQSCGAPLEGRL